MLVEVSFHGTAKVEVSDIYECLNTPNAGEADVPEQMFYDMEQEIEEKLTQQFDGLYVSDVYSCYAGENLIWEY